MNIFPILPSSSTSCPVFGVCLESGWIVQSVTVADAALSGKYLLTSLKKICLQKKHTVLGRRMH